MNHFFSPKFLVAATVAGAALGSASIAEARPEVYLSVGIQSGPVWVERAPVVVQPRHVYVRPAPVYLRPPVPVWPREVFERPRWDGYDARHHWRHERAWRRHEWRHHHRHDGWRGGWRDRDDRGHHRGHRD